MDDVPQIGEKSRMLMTCISRIKKSTDRTVIDDLVATINTLTIPRSYTYVDPDGHIHIVLIENASMMKNLDNWEKRARILGGMFYSVDVVWRFNPQSGVWNVIKDRTGVYESLCPMKCGGISATVQAAGGQ